MAKSQHWEVDHKLYLGSVGSHDLSVVRELGVTHVVNTTTHLPNKYEDHVKYMRVPVLNVRGCSLLPHITETMTFISEGVQTGKVLIFGVDDGFSRSSAIILAYLMKEKRQTLSAALEQMTKSYSINPNLQFIRDLVEEEKKCHGEASIDVQAYKKANQLGSGEQNPSLFITDLMRRLEPCIRTIVVGSHAMHVARINHDPRMAKISNFITHEEADYLINIATERGLRQSHVVNALTLSEKRKRGEQPSSLNRTSTSTAIPFGDPVASALIQRAATLCNLTPWHSEKLQVVHYGIDQKYNLHLDWFQPDNPGYEQRMASRGQRLVTIFVYLSDCPKGGHTIFPKLNVSFKPKKGAAVLWYNRDYIGEMDERVLHAGEPIEKGEKWGLNIWMRERVRDTAQQERVDAWVPTRC